MFSNSQTASYHFRGTCSFQFSMLKTEAA